MRNNFQPIQVSLLGVSISAIGSSIIAIFYYKSKIGVGAALVWLSGSMDAKGWGSAFYYSING